MRNLLVSVPKKITSYFLITFFGVFSCFSANAYDPEKGLRLRHGRGLHDIR